MWNKIKYGIAAGAAFMAPVMCYATDDTNIASLFSGTGALVTQIVTAFATLLVAVLVIPFIRKAYRLIVSAMK